MAVYFFDSSAIVKRYVAESGTAWVKSITDPISGNHIYLAEITGVEVVSAITRQARSGALLATFDLEIAIKKHSIEYDLVPTT